MKLLLFLNVCFLNLSFSQLEMKEAFLMDSLLPATSFRSPEFRFYFCAPKDKSEYCQLESNKQMIDSILHFIQRFPTVQLRMEYHTDLRGDSTFNLKLAQKRISIIESCFSDSGLPENHIEFVGVGERDPVIPEVEINLFRADKLLYERMHRSNNRIVLRVLSEKTVFKSEE